MPIVLDNYDQDLNKRPEKRKQFAFLRPFFGHFAVFVLPAAFCGFSPAFLPVVFIV